MHKGGSAYVLRGKDEKLPDYMPRMKEEILTTASPPPPTAWQTVFISGGRREKISKGDIAGLFIKQGKLRSDQIGVIEVKHDCAFVGVRTEVVDQLISNTDNTRLKKKKVRVRVI
jgi:hypothetical protein